MRRLQRQRQLKLACRSRRGRFVSCGEGIGGWKRGWGRGGGWSLGRWLACRTLLGRSAVGRMIRWLEERVVPSGAVGGWGGRVGLGGERRATFPSQRRAGRSPRRITAAARRIGLRRRCCGARHRRRSSARAPPRNALPLPPLRRLPRLLPHRGGGVAAHDAPLPRPHDPPSAALWRALRAPAPTAAPRSCARPPSAVRRRLSDRCAALRVSLEHARTSCAPSSRNRTRASQLLPGSSASSAR